MAATLPPTGARVTCTSKMLRKIPIRRIAASPIASSGGGAAAAIDTTIPSAGLISRPGLVGVTRHGSRKKYTIHKVATAAAQPAGAHNRNNSKVASTPAATNLNPSG